MTLDTIDMLLNSNISYQGKLSAIYELCNKQMKEHIRFGELPRRCTSREQAQIFVSTVWNLVMDTTVRVVIRSLKDEVFTY